MTMIKNAYISVWHISIQWYKVTHDCMWETDCKRLDRIYMFVLKLVDRPGHCDNKKKDCFTALHKTMGKNTKLEM